jgi:hypothetical protein
MGNSNSRKRAGGNDDPWEIENVIIRNVDNPGLEGITCIGKEDPIEMIDITEETNWVSILYTNGHTACFLQSTFIAWFDEVDKFNKKNPGYTKKYTNPMTNIEMPINFVNKIRNKEPAQEPAQDIRREQLLEQEQLLQAREQESIRQKLWIQSELQDIQNIQEQNERRRVENRQRDQEHELELARLAQERRERSEKLQKEYDETMDKHKLALRE